MKYCTILLILLIYLIPVQTNAQNLSMDLNFNWQFRKEGESVWHKAKQVPGSIYSDLFYNNLIPDPYFRDNEKKLQWVDRVNWEYKTDIHIDTSDYLDMRNIELEMDGLDTYANIYLNGQLILKADNMFRQWSVNIKAITKPGWNELKIHFTSALNKVDSIAKTKLPLVLPDNNRVYVRKAQFQFGWDWGPKFVGCGIWKRARINFWNKNKYLYKAPFKKPFAKLIQQKDSIGTSFYFEKDGKPIYIKGANWIPGDAFLRNQNKRYYFDILSLANKANMNMIRVWGGGVSHMRYFIVHLHRLLEAALPKQGS